MNPVQYRWCLYTVCVCALMHIWFVPALGGVHLVWHALSDWLHSDAVLGVSLSLHITYTHRHTHHTSNWIIITGLSKVSTCFSSFFLHVIIMDCVRIPWVHLGFFTLEASAFLAFSDIHFFYSQSTCSWSRCTLTFSPYSTIHFHSKRWPFQCEVCPMHITNHSAHSLSLILFFVFLFLNLCTSCHSDVCRILRKYDERSKGHRLLWHQSAQMWLTVA